MTKKLALILTAILLASCYNSKFGQFTEPGPTTTTTTCPQGMNLGSDMRCHY